MACPCPVIASDVAGCVPDLIEDGQTGKIVPVHNADQLAQAMEQLAINEDARTLMATQSAQRIAGYSPEACAHGIANAVHVAVKSLSPDRQ